MIISVVILLNMLTGILCEVVFDVQSTDADREAARFLRLYVLELMECYDRNDDRVLEQHEFELLMKNPDMHHTLKQFGVDAFALEQVGAHIFEKGQRIEFSQMMKLILRLRGGNFASVSDMVDLRVDIDDCVNHMLQLHNINDDDRALSPLEKEPTRRCRFMPLEEFDESHNAHGDHVHGESAQDVLPYQSVERLPSDRSRPSQITKLSQISVEGGEVSTHLPPDVPALLHPPAGGGELLEIDGQAQRPENSDGIVVGSAAWAAQIDAQIHALRRGQQNVIGQVRSLAAQLEG